MCRPTRARSPWCRGWWERPTGSDAVSLSRSTAPTRGIWSRSFSSRGSQRRPASLDLGSFNDQGWGQQMHAQIENAPSVQQPREPLVYTVALMNTSARAIPLPVCPTYTESLDDLLKLQGRVFVNRTYSLNCRS